MKHVCKQYCDDAIEVFIDEVLCDEGPFPSLYLVIHDAYDMHHVLLLTPTTCFLPYLSEQLRKYRLDTHDAYEVQHVLPKSMDSSASRAMMRIPEFIPLHCGTSLRQPSHHCSCENHSSMVVREAYGLLCILQYPTNYHDMKPMAK